jgi:hypothetical protein
MRFEQKLTNAFPEEVSPFRNTHVSGDVCPEIAGMSMWQRVMNSVTSQHTSEFNPSHDVKPLKYPFPGSGYFEKLVATVQLTFNGMFSQSELHDLDLRVDMTPLDERLRSVRSGEGESRRHE